MGCKECFHQYLVVISIKIPVNVSFKVVLKSLIDDEVNYESVLTGVRGTISSREEKIKRILENTE